MRPIFLTSACASTGVIPMLLGGSSLWMPMAAVIFWGTIITMFFILTVMPVAYWRFMGDPAKKPWQRGKDDVKITNRPVSLSSCRRTGPFAITASYEKREQLSTTIYSTVYKMILK